MDSLKPCQCRDSEPIVHRTINIGSLYWVTCIKCGRQTNMYESEKEAIGAWNRKAWQVIPLYKRTSDGGMSKTKIMDKKVSGKSQGREK